MSADDLQVLNEARETVHKSLEASTKVGPTTLSSGKVSPYFVNAQPILYDSSVEPTHVVTLLRYALADLVSSRERRRTPDASYRTVADLDHVGGPAVGGVLMTGLALQALRDLATYHVISGFYTEREPQTGAVELSGDICKDDKVVVVDDVATTGRSTLETIRAVEAVGAAVVRVVVLLDRLEGARAALVGYDFRPLFTVKDLDIALPPPEKGAP